MQRPWGGSLAVAGVAGPVWQQNERQSRRNALAGGALGRLCSDLGFKS